MSATSSLPPVLVGCTPAWRDTAPLLEIGSHLIQRGHEVTVIARPAYESAVRATGADFVPLFGAADWSPEEVSVEFPGRNLLAPGPAQFDFDTAKCFVDAIPNQHTIVQRLLAKRPESVLIADQLFLGAWPEALGVTGLRPARWISVACNPILISTPQATVAGPVLDPDGNVDLQATAAAAAAVPAQMTRSSAELRTVVLGMGGSEDLLPPDVLDGTVTLPDTVVALTIRRMEFDRSDLPSRIEFIGILPAPDRPDPLPAAVQRLLATDASVVLLARETLSAAEPDDLVEITLLAVADLPADVVVVTGDGAPLPSPLDRVAVIAPGKLAEVLDRVDVAITDGGPRVTQQSLAAGVPVIVAGQSEDKPLVAARVAATGAGVGLGLETPTVARIRTAVQQVLADPTFTNRATALAQEYATLHPYDRLDALLT